MKQFKAKLAAVAVGAALASAISAPAQAVTWSGNDGWEASYTGFINLFYNQLDFEYPAGSPHSGDSAVLNEGLLPSFHTMKAKSPEIGGLTGTSQITFAVDTSTDKGVHLNKSSGDDLIDLREVFFNVEGSFGTISVGRTLGLFQRQAILKDMTLFGVGGMANPDSNGTGLGRIGAGYTYADFRSRFAWQSPKVNGMQVTLGVFQPRETAEGSASVAATAAQAATQWTDTYSYWTTAAAPNAAVPLTDGVPTTKATADRRVTVVVQRNADGSQTATQRVVVQGTVAADAYPTTPTSDTTTPGYSQANGVLTVDSTALTTTADGNPAATNVNRDSASNAVAATSESWTGNGIVELETDMPQFQGEVTFDYDLGNGADISTWAGFLFQESEVAAGRKVGADITSSAWNVGGQVSMAGFSLLGSYYQGSGMGTLFSNGDAYCTAEKCDEFDSNGGYAQGTYTMHGSGESKTMLGVSWGYSESEGDASLGRAQDQENKGLTVGVYHDVNSWLKVIAEYNDYEYEHTLDHEVDGFSLGAFMFW